MSETRIDPIEGLNEFERAEGLSDPLEQEPELVRWDSSAVGGAGTINRLKNKNPRRHYVWVMKNSTSAALTPSAYQARGYRYARTTAGGERLFHQTEEPKIGDLLEDGFGNVLMWCSKAQAAENQRADPMSGKGQDMVDTLEGMILRKPGNDDIAGGDPISGLRRGGRSGVPYGSLKNTTKDEGMATIRQRPAAGDEI